MPVCDCRVAASPPVASLLQSQFPLLPGSFRRVYRAPCVFGGASSTPADSVELLWTPSCRQAAERRGGEAPALRSRERGSPERTGSKKEDGSCIRKETMDGRLSVPGGLLDGILAFCPRE